jgi:hypothetical protein
MLNIEQKLNYIITAFETYALGDISNVRKHKMPIAAFILGFCFIDQVSGFVYDSTKKGQKTNTDRSKRFVSDYLNKVALNKYDQDALIDILRNKLVHNYSVSDRKRPKHDRYVLEYENPKLHLHRDGDIVVINIDGFINDLKNAFQLYKDKLLTDIPMQKIAIANFDNYGILVHKEIKIY